jgi:hypothetical protein
MSIEDRQGKAYQAMQDELCFPWEWFQEELPIENKDGNALEKMVEGIVNADLTIPKTFESMFDKPPPTEVAELPKQSAARDDVLIFADSKGWTQKLLAAAPEGRVGTKKIVPYPSDTELDESDVKRIVGEKKRWDRCLFLAGLDPPKSNHVTNVIEQEAKISQLYLYVLKAVLSHENVKGIAVITRGVMCEDAKQHQKYGLGIISQALLFGMCNSARQELEDIPIQYIDTEWSLKATGEEDKYKIFPRLATECFRESTFGHNSVRILNKGRYVIREMFSELYKEANCEFIIPKKGIIAISGGNGALGLVMGQWLLTQCEKDGVTGLNIKFCSRSCKITDLNMPTWKEIQARAAALGLTVEQTKCDMSSQDAVDKFISELTPNLVGFIHSAGILADSMLMNLTWEKCEAVFDSKHRPALYLHSALERYKNDGLYFMWLFTSVSVWGNMGQINYSGSNHFLDALSRHRRGNGLPCVGMQWGAWGEVGMAATMSDSMRARTMNGPMPYFSNVEGLRGMEIGLSTGLPGFSVFKMNPNVMFGMTGADNGPNACFSRNWYSEIVPHPASGNLDKNGIYSALRTNIGDYRKTKMDKLNYNTWTKPAKKKYEEEWGDDFRTWTPIKA